MRARLARTMMMMYAKLRYYLSSTRLGGGGEERKREVSSWIDTKAQDILLPFRREICKPAGFFALAFDPPIKNRSPLASFLSPPGFFNVGYGCAPLAPPEPRCLRRRRRRKRREDGEDFPPLLVSTSVKTKKREKRKEEEEETEEKG